MNNVNLEKLQKLDFRLNEAYKILRTNIEFCGDDIKTIVITSCMANEGKSNVSLNLARSMAEAGKKVVFVDADLRKSVIAGRYKASRAVNGLSNYLCGQCRREDILYKTNVDNMSMIFSGPVPPNPAELIGNQYFQELLVQIRDENDYVIIDTPPLGSVIDSAIAAKVCDGIIMVIAANEISYKFAQKVKSQIDKTGCRILGVVLNKVGVGSKGYYGKYYSRYYSKYYGKYYGDESEDLYEEELPEQGEGSQQQGET